MARAWVRVITSGAMILFIGSCSTTGGRTPQQVKEDEYIAREVRSEILNERSLAGIAVAVRVFQGEVTLNGTVTDPFQKKLAGEIAVKVDGVVKVYNWIEVKYLQLFPRRNPLRP